MPDTHTAMLARGDSGSYGKAPNIAGRDMPAFLSAEMRGEIAILRLSRPAKRNALDLATVQGIGHFFSTLAPSVRAVVLHGEGAHFCAGVDLALVAEIDTSTALHGTRAWHRVFDQIEYGDVPVIAVLHGAVVGGGLELAAAAHIRVAERGTFYGLPEGSRGIFVGGGASVRVPRLIGVPRMMDMMLTGRTYGAEEGQALGLSHYLVETGDGLSKGIEIALRAAANAPLSNFAIIHALPRAARADPETGLLLESLMFCVAATEDEARGRIRAFLEKRAPKVSEPGT